MSRKRKQKVRTFTVVNRSWQYAVHVRIGGTRDEAFAYFGKKLNCDFSHWVNAQVNEFVATTFRVKDQATTGIWFGDNPGTGTVVHEALHSTQHALRSKGLGPLDENTEEAYAYSIEWLVKEIGRRVW